MYYKDCSKTFIDYVNAALERLNYQKNIQSQSNNLSNSSNVNISNMIQSNIFDMIDY